MRASKMSSESYTILLQIIRHHDELIIYATWELSYNNFQGFV